VVWAAAPVHLYHLGLMTHRELKQVYIDTARRRVSPGQSTLGSTPALVRIPSAARPWPGLLWKRAPPHAGPIEHTIHPVQSRVASALTSGGGPGAADDYEAAEVGALSSQSRHGH